MESYWFCPTDKMKLQTYYNRYSNNSEFTIKKGKIEMSLNNSAAVKKIEPYSIERGMELAKEYFNTFPEAKEIQCLDSKCPKCNKIYASPKNIRTHKLGKLELTDYNYLGPFRVPVAEKDPQDANQNRNYLFFYFRYYLYAYILNYTLLLEMKIAGDYRKVGLFVFFPIVFLAIVLFLVSQGYYYI